MTLSLHLQSPNTAPDGAGPVRMTGDKLSIGRGAENDLVLPDPDRTLSKRHCVLEQRNGDYVIVDISTNGTFLNYAAERLDAAPTPLNSGDVITVGSYEMVVEISADAVAVPASSDPLPPLDAAPLTQGNTPPRPAAARTLDDMSETGADFLDHLLGKPADAPAAKPADILEGLDDLLPPADPFAADPLDAPAAGLSDGSSAPDHTPSPQDHFEAPRPNMAQIPDNWADSFLVKGSKDAAPSDGPTSPPATPAEPLTPTGAPDAALRAFLEGAGAGHLSIPEAEVTQTMARMGKVMAAMTAGMRDILMTRAAIKGEMRMKRTMINNGENNPLKFSVSAEQAVETMIRPHLQGYLDAETAVTQALNDVKAHEVATMSGMEAALKDLLSRLSPNELSARMEQGPALGNLLGNKKARAWEAYEKMYAQIARETEDDFQSAFGKAFAQAYENQIKKL